MKGLKEMHVKNNPLILYNCWDVMSAKAIEKAGCPAIATSSFAMSDTLGYDDGQNLPFDLYLILIKNIMKNISKPLSVDFEAGFSKNDEELKIHFKSLLELGIKGINFEDKNHFAYDYELYPINKQFKKIALLRSLSPNDFFINARTDLFFQKKIHDLSLIDETLERIDAYKEAGADGIFIPGLTDLELIRIICEKSKLPVNIMVEDISEEILKSGVSRISLGPNGYLDTQNFITEQCQKFLG